MVGTFGYSVGEAWVLPHHSDQRRLPVKHQFADPLNSSFLIPNSSSPYIFPHISCHPVEDHFVHIQKAKLLHRRSGHQGELD